MTVYKLLAATLLLCLFQTHAFSDQATHKASSEDLKDVYLKNLYPVKILAHLKPYSQSEGNHLAPQSKWQLVAVIDSENSDGLVETELPISKPRNLTTSASIDDKITFKDTIDYQHYTISPLSAETIASAIDQTTPHGYHGYTKWLVEWKYTSKQLGNGQCEVDTATINLTTSISMPKLSHTAKQDTLINTKFNCYYNALMKHEMTHHSHALKAARKMSDVLSYHGETQCSDLYNELKAKWDDIHQQANDDDLNYDRDTEHGRTECVIIF
ncbi:DUF922 domain-containing protein [Endozoicomonas elysicola]|uniref:DUF922 domain-containing protein n=1 Tax=Endozoicomonas elysicola TaxID=305900 RepID=A0A081KCZ1_9GAMM|nr:DUF922 domain-containing protein [Endozoicomonas elysicola]KEI72017.1 hypothetical protein GV64_15955 [Endozoicomonas elysicola]